MLSSTAFRQIVWARALVWVAGAITTVALPLAVYQRTQSATLAAVLAAFEATPYLLVGLPAGAFADRWSARTISLVCCAVCACASGSIPVAAALDVMTTPHLFISAFVANTALVFFDAAMFAVLPAVVGPDDLMRAFSTTTAVGTTIRLAGPAAGGFLAAWLTPEYTLAIDTVMILAAATVFVAFREPHRTFAAATNPIRRSVLAGLAFIRRTAPVRRLTLLGTGNAVAEGIVTGMLIPAVVGLYGRSDSGGAVGVGFTVIALGALAATVVAPWAARRLEVRTITVTGLLMSAAGMAVWAWCPWFVPGLVALGLYQLGATVTILNGIAVRARITPPELQGRVNTTARMIAWGGQPIGGYGAGIAVGALGVASTLTVGVGVLVVTALTAVRALRGVA